MKSLRLVFSFLILLIFITGTVNAQITQPVTVLQASMMPIRSGTGNAFGSNNDWYLQDANGFVADSVIFPTTGVYKFDISAWGNSAGKTWPNLQIRIDGIAVANKLIDTTAVKIFSIISTTSISSGKHRVSIALTNDHFNGSADFKLKLGLCYITLGSVAGRIILPPIVKANPVADTYLTVNNWMSGRIRGFSLGDNSKGDVEHDFVDQKNLGSNLIRYFIDVNKDISGDGYSIQNGDGSLVMCDSLVAWGARHGFYVNVCFYITPHATDETFWGNTTQKTNIANLWKTVANHYKDSKTVACYTTMNEPTPAGRLGEYINFEMQLIDSIRTVDTNHVQVFPTCHDQNVFAMMEPLPWTNVLYEDHMYDPFAITNQGLIPSGIVPNPYPSSNRNSVGVYTKANMSARFNNDRQFVKINNAPMYIGEFGCVGWAPTTAGTTYSRDQWIIDCISLMEAEGWPWSLQVWRQYEGNDLEISCKTWYTQCPTTHNAFPTCNGGNFGFLDAFRTDTTLSMDTLKYWFKFNKVDTPLLVRYYQDADSDSYGNINVYKDATSQPTGYVLNSTDCDDTNPDVNPGAVEICNGIDDNCDGFIDENVKSKFFRDADNDGYGDVNTITFDCSPPPGYVTDSTDCDDTNPNVHPGATEICGDLIDNNCDGQIDEGCVAFPTITVVDTSCYEIDQVVNIRVFLNQLSSVDVSVNYHELDSTALSPSDYKALKGTVTIPAGQIEAYISIPIVYDARIEHTEYFIIKINNPINADLGDNGATIAIFNSP